MKYRLNQEEYLKVFLDVRMVNMIREDMERMEAHKLQPHFIEGFFMEAFKSFGGRIRNREAGRYQVLSEKAWPADVRFRTERQARRKR